MTRSKLLTAFQFSIRAALAAGLAVAAARLFHFESSLTALVAAVLVLEVSPSKTQRLALARLAGTALGASVGAALSQFLPAGPIAVGVSVLIAMLLSHFVRLDAGAKVAGYVSGIIVLAHQNDPWSYALSRSFETFLGISMAVLASLVPKLMKVEIADQDDA